MTNRATVRTADIRRTIKAATDAGLTVREIVMSSEQVRLVFSGVDAGETPSDPREPKEWPKDD